MQQGESVESIAAATGHHWVTIWDAAENGELRDRRGDPHVLHPGDELFIPALRKREVAGATERRHRFERRGVPSRLEVMFQVHGAPRASEAYVLVVDDREIEGETDAEGRLTQVIPPDARTAVVRFKADPPEQVYRLLLRHLNPTDDPTGVQARLRNLGYDVGPIDGESGPFTVGALKAFQRDCGLPVTGEPDDPTVARLIETHGS